VLSLEGALLNENFQEILNVFEAVGYDLAEGAVEGRSWRDGSLYLVIRGEVSGQIFSHVLEIELVTGSLSVLDESPTGDWVELADTYPNGDLLLRRSNGSTGELFFQRCTVELACTPLAGLTDDGRFLDIALSEDGLYYGGLALEPGFDPESAGPGAVVGRLDGSWAETVSAKDYWYQWSPTRNELAVITTGPPGNLYPLLLLIE
jgi:hypothetical protein